LNYDPSIGAISIMLRLQEFVKSSFKTPEFPKLGVVFALSRLSLSAGLV